MEKLRFDNYSIVLQEIPNEISLCFTITGCKLACEGCHSQHLWDSNHGQHLTIEIYEELLKKYRYTITCILYMGGEWHEQQLLNLIKIAHQNSLKVGLYTGLNEKQINKYHPVIVQNLDYIKTGKWISKLGGLNKKTTNQKLVDLNTGEVMNKYFIQ